MSDTTTRQYLIIPFLILLDGCYKQEKDERGVPARNTAPSPGIGSWSPLSRVLSLPLAISILPGKELLELFHLLRIKDLSNLLLSSLANGSIAPIGLLVEFIEALTAFPQNLVELSSL